MRALEVAKSLEADKVDVAVLHVGTIKPLDGETILREAARTGRMVVVAENHTVIGGLGEAVARLFAERAKQEAVRLNREGRYDEAERAIEGVRRRVSAYAGSDPELRALVAELREERPQYAAAMPEMLRKQVHFASSASLRSRMPDGKSQRRTQ